MVWSDLCDRAYGTDMSAYAQMSEEERLWINVRNLIDSTWNGGLISYFYNSGADRLDDCLAGLRRLGAHDVIEQVQRVMALFGEHVSTDGDERNVIIDAWSDGDPTIDAVLDETDDYLGPCFESLNGQVEEFARLNVLPHWSPGLR
jgi:hypothetical protein